MIKGYYVPRPNRENYDNFLSKLILGLEGLVDGLSLMFYGSFVRGELVYGRSDIDAVMIFPDDVVINKGDLAKVGTALYGALKGNNVPFQVTVADLSTMRDGRFNSYAPSFESYFNEEGKVIIGPDYRPEFKFEMPTHSEQEALKFNLRKARNGLLFAEHDRNEDYELFLSKFKKTTDAVSRGSKQIYATIDGQIRKDRFSVLKEQKRYFSNIDFTPLEEIRYLYHNLDKLDALHNNPDEVMRIWNSSLTFFEELFREYIRKFPKN